MDEYFISIDFQVHPALIVNINGEALNLKGVDIKQKIPATKNSPESEMLIRGATQEDLKFLYENAEVVGDFTKIINKRVKKGK